MNLSFYNISYVYTDFYWKWYENLLHMNKSYPQVKDAVCTRDWLPTVSSI